MRQGGGGQLCAHKICAQNATNLNSAPNSSRLNAKFHLSPKFYFTLGVIFNLCLLGFFKYTDFFLENFNAFSQITHLDFNIPLPHILLPLALSFVTFQQIAFLYDCFKRSKGELRENLDMNFIDYALFISFFPQLIAGPIVHHREMMPQFSKLGNSSLTPHCHTERSKGEISKNNTICHTEHSEVSHNDENRDISLSTKAQYDKENVKSKINYEFIAKGIFIFSIGLFKKVFIADTFAKWANAGFSVVEKGEFLNIAESWATSLSYTFQLYFDFSGYCDMAIGLGLMFGIVLPLNFNSPYKSLNISEFWRRWHITLGRFLTECVYIPLGGSRGKGNSSLAPYSQELEKSSIDRRLALSHSDFSAQPANLSQDTRIADSSLQASVTARQSTKSNTNTLTRLLTLRNIFIVFFLSGIWHGAGWGFIIWGILHAMAMMVHRIYSWFVKFLVNSSSYCHTEALAEVSQMPKNSRDISPAAQYDNIDCHANTYATRFLNFTQTKTYKVLCWLLTFNFVNLAWVFFRAENLNGALNLLKGMFGVVWVELPQQAYKAIQLLKGIGGTDRTFAYIIIALIVCVFAKNSFEFMQNFHSKAFKFSVSLRLFGKKLSLKGGAVFVKFALSVVLFYASVWLLVEALFADNAYSPFIYFNF